MTFVSAGNCIINADQAGNNEYAAAPQVQQGFQVTATPKQIAAAPALGEWGLILLAVIAGASGIRARRNA